MINNYQTHQNPSKINFKQSINLKLKFNPLFNPIILTNLRPRTTTNYPLNLTR